MACVYYMVVDTTVPKKDFVWIVIRSHPCHVCGVDRSGSSRMHSEQNKEHVSHFEMGIHHTSRFRLHTPMCETELEHRIEFYLGMSKTSTILLIMTTSEENPESVA